jgi:Zn-dependent peptidase ImmA (M78 family)
MAAKVSGINPKVLIWARERSGQSIHQVAQALKRTPDEIEAWESSSEAAPTYAQLEELSYRIYKRPLAIFFFPEPPDEPDPKQSFRTLPALEIEELGADTRFKVRQAQALQLALYELHGDTNPAKRKLFRDLRVSPTADPTKVASQAREYLGIDLKMQRDTWRSPDDALKGWRRALEEAGIYVFKNTFKQKDVSGFCLHDAEFPLIYVNNSTAKARQIFTLAHELGHLLVGTSGVTKRDDRYVNKLKGEPRQIEVFCNRFAAESLLPLAEVKRVAAGNDDAEVSRISAAYKVSRPVVLTRMLELGMITQDYYEKKTHEWKADYESKQDEVGGGNYYATQGTYFGERFLRLAFGKYYEGAISREQLAEYLNVPVRNLEGFEHAALQASGD